MKWAGGAGLLVAARKSTVTTMRDLWSVALEVRQTVRAWKRSYKLVREVREVRDGLLLLGQASTREAHVSLEALGEEGVASITGAASGRDGFALQRFPVDGALYVDLVKLRGFRSLIGMTPPQEQQPFEPFPALSGLPDDEP